MQLGKNSVALILVATLFGCASNQYVQGCKDGIVLIDGKCDSITYETCEENVEKACKKLEDSFFTPIKERF